MFDMPSQFLLSKFIDEQVTDLFSYALASLATPKLTPFRPSGPPDVL